jgi:uncharacterized protein
MLSLNLAKIRSAEEHFERVYPPEALGAETDVYTLVTPASLVFDIHKDKTKFRLVGRVTTRLEMPCSRCLEPFTVDVDASFDLRYLPHAELQHSAGEHEVKADDVDSAFYENDEIDLGQLMEEQFLLSLPMKPLCSDDCKGLCATCGTNLNKGACNCTTQWEDPRLAALKALKKES